MQRANLIDPGAPNPSVETLLHAFLPHKFVDHTHSTAVLSLADQPDAAERCADLYGRRMGLVPYIMPGFQLAKKAAEIFEADPAVEGLVLLKHGIFTFGETAREAYERMIAAVSLAEERLARRRTTVFAAARLPQQWPRRPRWRRSCAAPAPSPIRAGRAPTSASSSSSAQTRRSSITSTAPSFDRYGQAGVATPDHTIRTKNYPLIVPAPEPGRLDGFKQAVRDAVDRFVAEYHAYFARHNAAAGGSEARARPDAAGHPGAGARALRARRAAPGTRGSPPIIARIDDRDCDRRRGGRPLRVGRARPTSSTSNTGRWSRPSSARPARSRSPGQIAVVTGGAGTIGLATARAMSGAGAEVALLDIDGGGGKAAAKKLGGRRSRSPAT